MSQQELAKVTSPVYSHTFGAMVAGTFTTSNDKAVVAGSALANYRPSCSKIVGLQLVTAGGTVGIPYVNDLGAGASSTTGFVPLLQIRSSDALDTSVYKVFWVNEVISSQQLTILPC